MKKRKLTLITISTLTVSMVISLLVVGLSANYYPPPSIEIYSPIPAPDVHSTASVPLQVRVNILIEEADITFIRYSLDGAANVTLTNLTREDGLYYWTNTVGIFAHGNSFRTEAVLDDLAEGIHMLILYSHATDGKEMSKTREFIVDYDYVSPQVLPETPTQLPPSELPNGISTLPETPPTQTETINTANIQSLDPVPFIVTAFIAVSLLASILYIRKNRTL